MTLWKKAAFTLVELVICVIVVGILVSFAAVTRRAQKGHAEYMSALTHVRSLAAVVKNYIYSEGSASSTTSTADTESVYGINIPEGTFTRYTVSASGSDFTISARYNPIGDASSTDQTVFVWTSNGAYQSCSGSNCDIL